MTEYFAEQDEALQDAHTGGRHFGAGEGSAGPSASSSSHTPQQSSSGGRSRPPKKFATMRDFASGGGDSSDDDENPNQPFFAGGEKSGLAVQNPDDLKKKIIEKASK